jgi:hypothetical protein
MRPVRSVAVLLVPVVVLGLLAGCGSESESPAADDTTSSTTTASPPAMDSEGAASCVAEYSPDTLRERPFAFDGSVVELRDEVDPKAPTEDGGGDVVTTRALFEVHEWFAGGSAPTALVWMMRDVAVGERLLVTGAPRWGGAPLEDAIAWECGFTTSHSTALAEEWRAALSG